jgi:class 3 adenylate cyclase/tetratricopeptide (TPR) repeat protein
MRCSRCHETNPPHARFCIGCGQRLTAACPACGGELPDGARFCPACGQAAATPAPATAHATPAGYTPRHLAEKILVSRATLQGERKPVTVLFCDVVGSTALAERLGPDRMHDLLNRFFERALGAVHRYEGTVNQFLGDGFMALFGAPIAHEDHAQRAALAALDIARAVAEKPLALDSGEAIRLEIRMGLNTGLVVVGAIGDNLRMDYTAVGDTTHLAARLQQMAPPGAILASAATARLIEGYVAMEERGPTAIRGLSEPVGVYRLTGLGPRRSRLEGSTARGLSPFVGRARELGVLEDLLDHVRRGRGRAVGIAGEPGLGKSRLLLELRRSLGADAVTWLDGRCLSYGSTIPYLPVLDVLRAAGALAEADPPELIVEKMYRYLAELGLDAAERAPYLLHALGVKEDSTPVATLGGDVVMARTFDALRQLCVRESLRRPLVLAIEDLHWIDQMSEAWLISLADALAAAPILLVGTYRPGYRPAWLERSYATQLALAPLAREDSLAVIRSVLPRLAADDPVAGQLLDRGEGNAFFLEELARAAGTLARAEGDSAASPAGVAVPDTVHGVLTARIDRLPAEAKHLLQTASVLGREFPLRLLAAVADETAGLEGHLAELARLEFLHTRADADETTYVFNHALTQDVAYATLVASARRTFHRRAAEALPALFPGRVHELAPVLAHHYFEAEAWAEAAVHTRQAAETAQRSYANREAIAGYGRALVAAERAGLPTAARIELLEARADTHTALGDFDAARADLEAAERIAEHSGDVVARARALGALGALWGGHRDYQRGLEFTERAVALLEASGDRRALAEARARLGVILLNLTRMRDSRQELLAARALFREARDEMGDARTVEVLAMNAWISGDGEGALSLAEEATSRLHALGDRGTEVSALLTFAAGRACQRGWPAGEPLFARALEAALSTHAPAAEAYARVLTADVATYFGRYGLGLREASAGLEIARSIGHREWTAYGLGIVGRIHAVSGDAATARRLHEEMLDTARRLGATFWIAGALANLGADLLLLDDREGARRHLDESLGVAGEAVEGVMHAFGNLGDLELRGGRPDAALDVVRRYRDTGATFAMIGLDVQRVEGEALARLGEHGRAEAMLREVKTAAEALDVRPVLWRAGLALADALCARGHAAEADRETREARALLERVAAELPEEFRRGFATTDPVRRARAVA